MLTSCHPIWRWPELPPALRRRWSGDPALLVFVREAEQPPALLHGQVELLQLERRRAQQLVERVEAFEPRRDRRLQEVDRPLRRRLLRARNALQRPRDRGKEGVARGEVCVRAKEARRAAETKNGRAAEAEQRDILSAEAGSHTHTLRTRGVRTSHAHKPLRQANCLDTAAACRPTPRARTVPPSAPILRVPNIRGQSYTSSGVARRARRRA